MGDIVKRNKHYHCLEYDHSQKGDIYLVACGIEQCEPGADCGPHLRDCYHLHVVLSGTGVLYIGGKTFYPHFGQMFLLKHNEECRYIADEKDPWNYCWVTFNGTEAKRLTEEIGFVDGIYCLDSAVDAKEFYELVVRMHEKPEMNYINDLRRRGILFEFLALALEAVESQRTNRMFKQEYSTEYYINRAVDFIHYNYATITVEDIVEYIGFNRSYFSMAFKRYVGISPQKYLIQHRLKVAAEMLRDSELSVQSITEKVGYQNPLTFSGTFKKAYGVSPSEYRRNHQ